MNRAIQLLAFLVVVWTVGSVVRDLTATAPPSQAQADSMQSYIATDGRPVSLETFRGNYLCLDYAAAWRSYCVPQTRTIKRLDRDLGDRLLFVTVVAGTDAVMQPPSAATARACVEPFGLDQERVLARFGTDTLPHHVLYSPDGEVLYRDSGLLDRERILAIVREKTSLSIP